MRMSVDDFIHYSRKHDANITRMDDDNRIKSNNFMLCCKKCHSVKVEARMAFDYRMGSEQTGIYDEETALFLKCLDCGCAESFIPANYCTDFDLS